METIEELKREISRLQQDLAFARDNACQETLKAAEYKKTLRDEFAAAAITGFTAAIQSIQDVEDFKADGGNVVWQIADSVLKARNG